MRRLQGPTGSGSPAPSAADPAPSRAQRRVAAGGSRHGVVAQLLMVESPLTVILVAYAVAGWVAAPIDVARVGPQANRLGFSLHVAGPADLDRDLFGVVPTVWLQHRLLDGSLHWYDAVATLVYSTHFVVIPVVTALVWFRTRERYAGWVVAVVAFIGLGVAGYLLLPAAPPWLASDHGTIGPVSRISDLGWDYLHLDRVGGWIGSGQADSNPVAAMPSLHAGSPVLVGAFLWPVTRPAWRAVLVVYVLLMAASVVYTGEHYVVDVLAGWTVALVAVGLGALLGPRLRRSPRLWASRQARRPVAQQVPSLRASRQAR